VQVRDNYRKVTSTENFSSLLTTFFHQTATTS